MTFKIDEPEMPEKADKGFQLGSNILEDIESWREYQKKKSSNDYYSNSDIIHFLNQIIEFDLRRKLYFQDNNKKDFISTEKESLEKEAADLREKWSLMYKWFCYYQNKSKGLEKELDYLRKNPPQRIRVPHEECLIMTEFIQNNRATLALMKAANNIRGGSWYNGTPSHIFAELLAELKKDGWVLTRRDLLPRALYSTSGNIGKTKTYEP